MMNETMSALDRDLFSPIATLAIPGAIASWPAFVWELHQENKFGDFLHANPAISSFGLIVIALGVGLILEVVGACIEAWVWDPLLHSQYPDFYDVWKRYLRLAFKTKPEGLHYLNSRVTVLKFELGAGVALILQGLGVQNLLADRAWFVNLSISQFSLISCIAGLILLGISYTCSDLLHKTRANLLQETTLRQ